MQLHQSTDETPGHALANGKDSVEIRSNTPSSWTFQAVETLASVQEAVKISHSLKVVAIAACQVVVALD